MHYSMSEIEAFVARFWQKSPNDKFFISPYSYTVTFTGLTQGSTLSGTVQVQANADFLLLDIAFRANIGAAQNEETITAPFVRVLVSDAGSNEQFTNAAVDLEAYASNARRNKELVYPRIVQGRSVLNIQATSYAPTAETYAFDLLFHGVHIRRY